MQVSTNLPWLAFLPDEEQEIFFLELASEILTARQTNRAADLDHFIDRWQATAETYASPDLAMQLAQAKVEGALPPSDAVGIEDLDRAHP